MQKITLLLTFLLTLALSTVLIVFFDSEKTTVSSLPKDLYQVYLAGEKIGVIASKDKLEAYIDKKQEEIKNKYNVDNVYPPEDLNVQKYISYGDKVLSEEDVYELIKEKSPYTIKGYAIKIKTSDGDKVINVIDKSLFEAAVTKTVTAFVPSDDYDAFVNDKQTQIDTTGKIIEDLYVNEDITIKEAFISTDEYIFTDGNLLDKYLLFGTLDEQEKYVVQAGDTIEQISFSHQLGTEEFLVVNPTFSKSNSLLFPGQEVTVGLIQPIFNVVVEEHVVEDQTIKYETETTYDDTIASGTTTVKQEGADGVERVIQKRQTTNGVITNVQIDRASSYVVKEAVKKIIVKGTKSIDGGTVTVSPDGNWVWPTNTPYVLTSNYAYRWGKLHDGLDISGTGYGSPIRAARAGTVVKSGWDASGGGNEVIILHENNYYTVYAHCSKLYAREGETVTAGQVVAAMGNSGYVVGATGTHLHFGAFVGYPYKGGKSFNPLLLYQ